MEEINFHDISTAILEEEIARRRGIILHRRTEARRMFIAVSEEFGNKQLFGGAMDLHIIYGALFNLLVFCAFLSAFFAYRGAGDGYAWYILGASAM